MRAGASGAAGGRVHVLLGVVALAWALLHAGLTALALTTGPTHGPTTEALGAMRYASPLLAALSFCGAALAFSGRTPARRPGLAGAAFLVLASVCAVVVATCAALAIRHAGLWALWWLAVNLPLAAALAACRALFRSAQRGGPRGRPGGAGRPVG